jgi:chitinase
VSRLLGLFIWSIDLDDTDHTALKAVLGGKLGTFATQNGYDPNFKDDDGWDSITGNDCTWSGMFIHKRMVAIHIHLTY